VTTWLAVREIGASPRPARNRTAATVARAVFFRGKCMVFADPGGRSIATS
jgi:hypothetical protein